MSTQKKGERKRDKFLRGLESAGAISLGAAGVALAVAAAQPRTVVVRETVVRPRYILDDVIEEEYDMFGQLRSRKVRRGF